MIRKMLIITILVGLAGAAPAQGKEVEFSTFQLSGTLYMLMGSGGNVGVSIGKDGVYLIDDQVEPVTAGLLQAISKLSPAPIRFVINTHYHGDHVGGNEAIGGSGAVIVAHDNVRRRMASERVSVFMNETAPPYPHGALPVLTFNDRVSLHFNGESATAYHVASGHTDGDSIIHFPASNVIHMGDMYFNGLYPYIDLDAGGSVQGMIEAADLALTLADEATRIIPGHGPLAGTQELKRYRDFLVTASAKVQALINEGMSLKQAIAATPTAEWDEELGDAWIKPDQFVTFLYNSLQGIHEYTRH